MTQQEQTMQQLREFEFYLTRILNETVKQRISEENIFAVVTALANCLTLLCFQQFGSQLAPDVISSAVNRAIKVMTEVENQQIHD